MLSATQEEKEKLFISEPEYKEYRNMLIKLEKLFSEHPIIENKSREIKSITQGLDEILSISKINELVLTKVEEFIKNLNKKSME